MNVHINGKSEALDNQLTISILLEKKRINPDMVVVEINELIINRNKYNSTKLQPNDHVEILYFVGGGTWTN